MRTESTAIIQCPASMGYGAEGKKTDFWEILPNEDLIVEMFVYRWYIPEEE